MLCNGLAPAQSAYIVDIFLHLPISRLYALVGLFHKALADLLCVENSFFLKKGKYEPVPTQVMLPVGLAVDCIAQIDGAK